VAEILLIDDSPTDSHAYSGMLRARGHKVHTASNGAEGIALAASCKPDVILMDVVMPGVNGYEATRELTRDHGTAGIPVIMISTKNLESDRIWGLRQGAVDYLVKPVKRRALLRSVDTALAGA